MIRAALSLLLLCFCALGAAEENKAFFPGAKERIVFVGDSITAGGQYVEYIEAYLRTRYPERDWEVVYKGKGSETVSNLSEVDHPGRRPCLFQRFEADVVAQNPTLVVACYGMNDGIYHPFGEDRFAAFQEGIRTLIARVKKETKARFTLATPPPYDTKDTTLPDDRPLETYGYKKPWNGYDQVLAKYAAWELTLATDDMPVASIHTPFRETLDTRRKEQPEFRIAGDTIHPNPNGHLLMALAVLKAWNAKTRPSALRIEARPNEKKPRARSKADVEVSRDGTALEIVWKTNLAWPADPRWDPWVVAHANVAALNTALLVVEDLPPGEYRILADGTELTTASEKILAAGLDVNAIPTFPTVTKGAGVLDAIRELRKKRNAAEKQTDPDLKRRAEAELEAQTARVKIACAPIEVKIRIEPVK